MGTNQIMIQNEYRATESMFYFISLIGLNKVCLNKIGPT